jgi:vancomycin resistance protein YoaR
MQGSVDMNTIGADGARSPLSKCTPNSNWAANLLLCALPVGLALSYWWFNPFSTVLVLNSASLSGLSAAQKANIDLAGQAVNDFVLAPGQTFSFNRTVGLRSDGRGYLRAPSYLGDDTPKTLGGGVCLLSSLLYRDALELNLAIKERHPHTRTIQTVPPGFDATVWAYSSDLKFTNTSGVPLQIKAKVEADSLKVELLGDRYCQSRLHRCTLKRAVAPSGPKRIEVTVEKEEGGKLTLLSRDIYYLPTRLGPVQEEEHSVNH